MALPPISAKNFVQLVTGLFGAEPVPVSASNPLPVSSDGVADGAVAPGWDGSTKSTAGYGSAWLEVTAMGGATSIAVKAGTATPPTNQVDVFNAAGSTMATAITATGLYNVPAAGNIAFTATGGTPTINLILKR